MFRRSPGVLLFCLGLLAVVLTPALTPRAVAGALGPSPLAAICAHAAGDLQTPVGGDDTAPASDHCRDCVLCGHSVAMAAAARPTKVGVPSRVVVIAWRPTSEELAPARAIAAALARGPPARA